MSDISGNGAASFIYTNGLTEVLAHVRFRLCGFYHLMGLDVLLFERFPQSHSFL